MNDVQTALKRIDKRFYVREIFRVIMITLLIINLIIFGQYNKDRIIDQINEVCVGKDVVYDLDNIGASIAIKEVLTDTSNLNISGVNDGYSGKTE